MSNMASSLVPLTPAFFSANVQCKEALCEPLPSTRGMVCVKPPGPPLHMGICTQPAFGGPRRERLGLGWVEPALSPPSTSGHRHSLSLTLQATRLPSPEAPSSGARWIFINIHL